MNTTPRDARNAEWIGWTSGRDAPAVCESSVAAPRGVLVIGYGNPLREDDGLGPEIVSRLAARGVPGVRTRSVHQLGPELAEELSTVALAVFVDARVGPAPQDVMLQPLTADCASWSMTHVFAPELLLVMARTLYGQAPAAWSLQVLGERFGAGEGLSPAASQRADHALEIMLNLLTQRETSCGRAPDAQLPSVNHLP